MVDVITTARSASPDNSQPRLAPTTTSGPAAQAAVDAPAPTRTTSFVQGTIQAADANPASTISPVGHVTGSSCPACTSGDPHWSHAQTRSAPGMDQVVASQLVTGPNEAPVD
jgi:hypothetical protein